MGSTQRETPRENFRGVGGINGRKTERKYRAASDTALGSAIRESLGA